MGLRHDPVRVARERPAGDGAHQRLALAEAAHEVGHEVGQVRHHAAHAAVRHRAHRQDAALLPRNTHTHTHYILHTTCFQYKCNASIVSDDVP